MKYTLYRSRYELPFDEAEIEASIDREEEFDLVAVEYAANIDQAIPLLIKAIIDELSATPQYSQCKFAAYSPNQYARNLSEEYTYEMIGIVYPPVAAHNILILFTVKEEPETLI